MKAPGSPDPPPGGSPFVTMVDGGAARLSGPHRSHAFEPSMSSRSEPLAESIRPFSDRKMPSNPSPAVQKASHFSRFFTFFSAFVSMPDVSVICGRRARAAGDLTGSRPVPLPDELGDYRLNIFGTRVPFVWASCISDENLSSERVARQGLNFRRLLAARINQSLRALEYLRNGSHSRRWISRVFRKGDSIDVRTLQSSSPSSDESSVTSFRDAPSVSRGGARLLARLSSFWREFRDRFPALSDEHAFGGRNVRCQPEAVSCEIFSAGYTLDEELCEGVRRGDVYDPRVDPVKVETISLRVNLLFADWERLMFIRKPLVMFFGCLERPNGPKA